MPTGILTISSYTAVPPIQVDSNSLLEIRGWYSRDFISTDGVTPIFGNSTNGEQGPYFSTTPTLNGSGEIVVPAHDVQITVGANPTANYFEGLWVDGTFAMLLMPNTNGATGWQIPSVYGDPIAYDEIATYNRARRLVYPPDTYFTADDTIAEIRRIAGDQAYAAVGVNGITSMDVAPAVASLPIAVGANSYASSSHLGISKLSVSPASASNPIAVGDNDPRVSSNYPVRLTLPYSGSSVGAQLRALKLSGGVATLTTPSDTSGCIAIGLSAGTNEVIAVGQGYAQCAVDGSVAIGDYLHISDGNSGFLKSVGAAYPTSGQVVGRALSADSEGLIALDFFGSETLVTPFATTSVSGKGKSTVTRSPESDVTFTETTDPRLPATTSTLFADRYSGDFGQKIASAIAALPSTGGIIDARMLTGAQSLSSDLTISKSYVTILVGNNFTLTMGTSRILFSSGIFGSGFAGSGAFGSTTSEAAGGAFFTYSGTDYAFKAGGAANTFTEFIFLRDIAIKATNSAGGALKLTNVLFGDFRRVYFMTPGATNTAIGINVAGQDGTFYSAFNLFLNCRVANFRKGYSFNIDSNSNQVIAGSVQGPNAVAGSVGIEITATFTSVGNYIAGTYVSAFETGISMPQNAWKNYVSLVGNIEFCTVDVSIGASSVDNVVDCGSPNNEGTIVNNSPTSSVRDPHHLALGYNSTGTQQVLQTDQPFSIIANGRAALQFNANTGQVDLQAAVDGGTGALNFNRASGANDTNFYNGNTLAAKFTSAGEFIPNTDNTGSLGTALKRWTLIRGVTITSGDLFLSDKEDGRLLYKISETDGGIHFDDAQNGKRLMRLDRDGNLHLAGRIIEGHE